MWLALCVFVFVGPVLGSVVRPIDSQNLSVDKESRIKSGNDAIKGAYPWQVSIGHLDKSGVYVHDCGGSIINEQWVVSAAHCFYNANAANHVIVAGEHNSKIDEGTEQTFYVEKIISHKGFSPYAGSNDVAVLKISGEFKFNLYVAPIQLATPGQHDVIEGNRQLHCITSGWGKLDFGGSPPSILQALVMPLLPLKTCKDAYKEDPFGRQVTEDMLCTGHIQGDKSPCHGDSGGPLACLIDDEWTLTGIVSWGMGCGMPGYPGLFARVTYFYNWITNKVANN